MFCAAQNMHVALHFLQSYIVQLLIFLSIHHIEKCFVWNLYALMGSIFYVTVYIRLLNDELLFRNMLKVYRRDVDAVPDLYKDMMGGTCGTYGGQKCYTRAFGGEISGRPWRRTDECLS